MTYGELRNHYGNPLAASLFRSGTCLGNGGKILSYSPCAEAGNALRPPRKRIDEF